MDTFGGMEDYRKMEANPLTIGNYTIGLERYGVAGGSNIDDKARADRLRADFLARNARGNEEHSKTRQEALSRALLSSAQVRRNESLVCGMTPEARRQLWFTLLLIAVSLNHTVMSSIEQRFVGHLGKDSMAARSISFSVIMYFYGISSMWAAISTKIGRAVGARDYPAIGKYVKMAIRKCTSRHVGQIAAGCCELRCRCCASTCRPRARLGRVRHGADISIRCVTHAPDGLLNRASSGLRWCVRQVRM